MPEAVGVLGLSRIGRVQTSGLSAHKLTSDAAYEQVNHAQASGNGLTVMALDSDLDACKDCLQCICWGRRCLWELQGKAKLCMRCWDNKQKCDPARVSGAHPPLKVSRRNPSMQRPG